MEYPSSFGTRDWLERHVDGDGTIVPFYFEPDSRTQRQLSTEESVLVHSFIHVTDDDFSTHYLDTNSVEWIEQERISLSREPVVDFTDVFTADVYPRGQDSEPTLLAHQQLGRTIESIYGLAPFPYDVESARAMFDLQSPTECNHDAPTTNIAQEVQGGEDVVMSVCSRCTKPFNVMTQAAQIARGDLLTRDISSTSAEIYDIADGLSVARFNFGEDELLDSITGLLTQDVHSITRQASDLEIGQDTLLLSFQDTVIGYLCWEDRWGSEDLHQVYIIEEAQRNGFAKLLVTFWIANFVDGDEIYADQPNEYGFRMLESVRESSEGLDIIPYSRFYPIGAEPYSDSSMVKIIKEAL